MPSGFGYFTGSGGLLVTFETDQKIVGLSKDTFFDCYSSPVCTDQHWLVLFFVDPPEHVSRQSRTCVLTVVQLRNDNDKE